MGNKLINPSLYFRLNNAMENVVNCGRAGSYPEEKFNLIYSVLDNTLGRVLDASEEVLFKEESINYVDRYFQYNKNCLDCLNCFDKFGENKLSRFGLQAPFMLGPEKYRNELEKQLYFLRDEFVYVTYLDSE